MASLWTRSCRHALAVLCLLASPAAAEMPDVVVTIKPVHALVAAVMEGTTAPHLLLDGATSPHTYAMRPSDARRLSQADIVVRVSADYESFLARPLAQLAPRTRIVTLDRLPGMTLHPMRSGDGYEAHDHGHGHAHSHGHAKPRGAKTAPPPDGHLWLDPENAKVTARHMAEVLAEAVPAEAGRFRANARALIERLEALDGRLAEATRPLAGRPYLVFHDAYQYFERRYGLKGAGSVTVNPEVPPSARRLTRLRARLKSEGIVCVFAEPQFPPRAVQTIVEGSKVRRGVLDPLGAAMPAGPRQYFDLMQGLARDLKECLLASA